MTVAAHGVKFSNKGAELMLRAIVQEVSRWPARVAVDLRTGSFRQRRSVNAQHLARFDSVKLSWANALLDRTMRVVPEPLRRQFGLVAFDEVDVMLDASGFAFTDQWGPGGAELAAATFQQAKRRGAKVILLPQAFGPFEQPRVRRAVEAILRSADLVFARDEQSQAYLADLNSGGTRIERAPDFTNLLEGAVVPVRPPFVCVIPNYRMVDKTRPEVARQYTAFLADCVRCVLRHGTPVKVLIHETDRDEELAYAVREAVEEDIEIICEQDALRIKGIIGQSLMTVSSRFHGLINALSQGVPALATSWSHKYRELMRDYDSEAFLFSSLQFEEETANKIDYVLRHREEVAARVECASAVQKKEARAMWQTVREVTDVGGKISVAR